MASARSMRWLLWSLLAVLTALAAGQLALIPQLAADASGCTRETGDPMSSPTGPACLGDTGSCYMCEHTSGGGGGTLFCAEAPNPEDGQVCIEAESLPGRNPQNQD